MPHPQKIPLLFVFFPPIYKPNSGVSIPSWHPLAPSLLPAVPGAGVAPDITSSIPEVTRPKRAAGATRVPVPVPIGVFGALQTPQPLRELGSPTEPEDGPEHFGGVPPRPAFFPSVSALRDPPK